MGIDCRIFPDMHMKRNRDQALFLLLSVVFVEQIRSAYKNGIFRCYRNYEKNDSRLRGRIQVERHIKASPIFNGKIAYTYREYTADNDINRIIFTAYRYLMKQNGSFMRNLINNPKYHEVKDFFTQMGNVTTAASRQEIQQMLRQNKKKISHSVYQKWEPVRKTAIQILRHMGIKTYQSGISETTGVLINMPQMWESYLQRILEQIPDVKFEIQYSKSILDHRRTLRPDFWDQQHGIVLDAKYKNGWEEIAKQKYKSWPREDTYQILSYMYSLRCKIGGIMFPVKGDYTQINENGYMIDAHALPKHKVLLLPLKIPEEQDQYKTFTAQIKKSEEDLQERLKSQILDTAT